MSRLKLVLLSLMAVVALSAVATGSASATEFFNESGTLISSALLIKGLGGTQILKGEPVAGTKVEISCTHLDVHGSINNVSGMGLGLVLLLYLTCTVIKPAGKGCVVANGGNIHVPTLHVLAVGTSTAPEIEFAPEGGTTFVNIVLEKCEGAFSGLNGKNLPVTGKAFGQVNNATSEVSVDEVPPNSHLEFGGLQAEYVGKASLEMEGGGKIEVK